MVFPAGEACLSRPGRPGRLPDTMPRAILASLLVFLGLSVIFDLRARRIPNLVSGPAIVVGLVLNAAYSGASGLLASLAGAGLVIGILMWPFAAGGIGGGDVKMMGAVGAFVGPGLAVMGLVIGMILGGIIMSAHLVRLGRLREKLASLGRMVAVALGTRSVQPLMIRSDDETAITLPYSVPLAIGTLIALGFVRGIG
jgi:prepilin peptidase CpaA